MSHQVEYSVVERNLIRARKLTKDLLEDCVVVNAERVKDMENLNVGLVLTLTLYVDTM